MRDFTCPVCGQHLAFDNSLCLSCRSPLGYSLDDRTIRVIGKDGVDPTQFRLCDNLHLARCNWLVPVGIGTRLCESCRLTRTRPADGRIEDLGDFANAEAAKRRLIVELTELGLPIVGRDADPEFGLAFDLLSSRFEKVITGHFNGVITLDLAEGDDVHRERVRVSMAEPYRTLLGHFRHEIGHYYYPKLVTVPDALNEFIGLFGDPNVDYQCALEKHYDHGAPPGWERTHVSSYATMHPAEDWAETFAHYLHIRDTLDTAAAFAMAPAAATFDRPPTGPSAFDQIIELWLPLSWSLNMVNRSMGHPDLYPFVLPSAVLEKMRFIHTVITRSAT